MAKKILEDALTMIESVLRQQGRPLPASEILQALPASVPLRTLQHRLKSLVSDGRVAMEGRGRWAKYRLPQQDKTDVPISEDQDAFMPLSGDAQEIRDYVRRAPHARRPVGYDRGFLDGYRPNVAFYLTEKERAHLAQIGRPQFSGRPAGTYARHILNRLLIDLAWNSSRLEGNTYSLLDTKRLIEFGEEAEGRAHLEAQMILNHKDAIEFLVSADDGVGFNRHTILNLHGLLANNLLADPSAAGRLRHIAVGIEKSVFHPLETPQLVEEAFDQVLITAEAVADPFEQAFFAMVHIPYLQPFDDVNKRVSRLAANIPFIKNDLSPLSFADVPQDVYVEAMLGVYELRRIDLFKELFLWAYERSAARYAAVRQSLGEPDPFRLRYRLELRELIAQLIREQVGRKEAVARVASWSAQKIAPADLARFTEAAEQELTNLHEGNFARYRVRPSEFAAWRKIWEGG